MTKNYKGELNDSSTGAGQPQFIKDIEHGNLTAQEILTAYCNMLYMKYGTYEKVAQITKLDRRTAKKYIETAQKNNR